MSDTPSLHDTYYDYLSHIALTLMLDEAAMTRSHFVSLTRVTDIMESIVADGDGDGLIPQDDIAVALDRLIAADIIAPLDHPEQGKAYHVMGSPCRSFFDAQVNEEGSTIWKCKNLPGYMQMVLEAMHAKKQEGFN